MQLQREVRERHTCQVKAAPPRSGEVRSDAQLRALFGEPLQQADL